MNIFIDLFMYTAGFYILIKFVKFLPCVFLVRRALKDSSR